MFAPRLPPLRGIAKGDYRLTITNKHGFSPPMLRYAPARGTPSEADFARKGAPFGDSVLKQDYASPRKTGLRREIGPGLRLAGICATLRGSTLRYENIDER
jgi:hypothetical protein